MVFRRLVVRLREGDGMKNPWPLGALVLIGLVIGLRGRWPQPEPRLTPAEQLAKEKAGLLRPFDSPHPFEPEGEGYRIIFPGRPTTPQFRDIMHDGSTWVYEAKERLGPAHFSVERTKKRPFYEPSTDRRHIEWSMGHYRKWWEDQATRPDRANTVITERYTKFAGRYEAAELVVRYEITKSDYLARIGRHRCRHWYIVTADDIYEVHAEGTEDFITSPLVDAFFRSFDLVPKAPRGK
jgi:hypothetical protein